MKNLIYVSLIACIFAACGPMQSVNNMKAEANKQGVQRFYDQVINAHNPAAADSFCTAEFVDHNPAMGHSGKGMDDLKASFKDFFAAYPDVHITANMIATNGDTVMAMVTMTGTNSGTMMGHPATNKQVNIQGTDIMVLKDGKATDRWGFFEDMKMMQQLGMMPEMGKMPTDSMKKM